MIIPQFFRPTDKQTAERVAEQCRSVTEATDAAALAVISLAMSGKAFAAGIVEGGLVVVRVFALKLGRGASQFASDPPNFRYDQRTVLLGSALYRDALDEEPFGRAAADFADGLIRSRTYLDAMVRSIEKAQGAALTLEDEESPPERSDLVRSHLFERMNEATAFSASAADALEATEGTAFRFAEALHEVAVTNRPVDASPSQVDSRRFDQFLPSDALAVIFRSGVRIEDVRRVPMARRADYGALVEAPPQVMELGRALGNFAPIVRGWEPPAYDFAPH